MLPGGAPPMQGQDEASSDNARPKGSASTAATGGRQSRSRPPAGIPTSFDAQLDETEVPDGLQPLANLAHT